MTLWIHDKCWFFGRRFLVAVMTMFCLVLTAAPSSAAELRVAVLGLSAEGPREQDIQEKLMASGAFASVDVIGLSPFEPVLTLSELLAYDSVIVYTDAGTGNLDELGDNLADYVDAGGGVVVAAFGHVSAVFLSIGGRFDADDYWALLPAPQSQTGAPDLALGEIVQPGHPVMAGVTSFIPNACCWRTLAANGIHANATVLAFFNDGVPLVVTRQIGMAQRVDLNFFPPSSDALFSGWDATTDGALLMSNALVFVAGAVPQLACSGADEGVFEAPLDEEVTINKGARVLPFRMVLTDTYGFELSDLDEPLAAAAPMIEIDVLPGTASEEPPEILETAGKGDDGNQFRFADGQWKLNLRTKGFSGPATYMARAVSGDPSSYEIEPTCSARFFIKN